MVAEPRWTLEQNRDLHWDLFKDGRSVFYDFYDEDAAFSWIERNTDATSISVMPLFESWYMRSIRRRDKKIR